MKIKRLATSWTALQLLATPEVHARRGRGCEASVPPTLRHRSRPPGSHPSALVWRSLEDLFLFDAAGSAGEGSMKNSSEAHCPTFFFQ